MKSNSIYVCFQIIVVPQFEKNVNACKPYQSISQYQGEVLVKQISLPQRS